MAFMNDWGVNDSAEIITIHILTIGKHPAGHCDDEKEKVEPIIVTCRKKYKGKTSDDYTILHECKKYFRVWREENGYFVLWVLLDWLQAMI